MHQAGRPVLLSQLYQNTEANALVCGFRCSRCSWVSRRCASGISTWCLPSRGVSYGASSCSRTNATAATYGGDFPCVYFHLYSPTLARRFIHPLGAPSPVTCRVIGGAATSSSSARRPPFFLFLPAGVSRRPPPPPDCTTEASIGSDVTESSPSLPP
jgi:hypothetical protein